MVNGHKVEVTYGPICKLTSTVMNRVNNWYKFVLKNL